MDLNIQEINKVVEYAQKWVILQENKKATNKRYYEKVKNDADYKAKGRARQRTYYNNHKEEVDNKNKERYYKRKIDNVRQNTDILELIQAN